MAINDASLVKWVNDFHLIGCSDRAIERVQASIDRIRNVITRQAATDKKLRDWERRYDELYTKIEQLRREYD